MVYVLGDSHATTLDHKTMELDDLDQYFIVCGQMSTTAYSIVHKEPHRVELYRKLKSIPEGSKLLFIFGEIDCRYRVFQHKRGRSLEETIDEVVDCYLSLLKDIEKENYKINVWGPHPLLCPYINPVRRIEENVVYKSYAEVLDAVSYFNTALEIGSKEKGFLFATIGPYMISNNLYLDRNFYRDATHLGVKSVPLIIEELKKVGII